MTVNLSSLSGSTPQPTFGIPAGFTLRSTITSSGNVSYTGAPNVVYAVVVGGGASGANGTGYTGGGGGAGAVLAGYTTPANTVTIGAGGSGNAISVGNPGGITQFGNMIAQGGGAAVAYTSQTAPFYGAGGAGAGVGAGYFFNNNGPTLAGNVTSFGSAYYTAVGGNGGNSVSATNPYGAWNNGYLNQGSAGGYGPSGGGGGGISWYASNGNNAAFTAFSGGAGVYAGGGGGAAVYSNNANSGSYAGNVTGGAGGAGVYAGGAGGNQSSNALSVNTGPVAAGGGGGGGLLGVGGAASGATGGTGGSGGGGGGGAMGNTTPNSGVSSTSGAGGQGCVLLYY